MREHWLFKRLSAASKPIIPVPKEFYTNPLYFIAFGFGAGFAPFAPGTFGTLFAIPFYLLLRQLSLPYYLLVVLIIIGLTSWMCDYISRKTHTHDHPGMCIDEFVGYFVTMINAPHGVFWILLGFALFRLFDIWKPWPIRYLDKHVHGGFGMIIDDVVAGIFAMIIIQLLS